MNIIEQNEYCKYIYKSRYARWRDDLGRRENWEESVTRLCDFWKEKSEFFPYELIYNAIYEGQTMPSMRSLMTAGKALERDNVAGFNCSFVAIDDPKAFDEILYILACGTGVGFSVERQEVQQLPVVAEEFFPTDTVIQVKDSKIGWASGLRELISLLYSGKTPTWDLSKVRPAGSLLKTFGGRASGPGPLNDLFKFTVALFVKAQGRKLTSLECHDLVCKIAEIIVVGGVRRSALISLSNLSDDRMRKAKQGAWWDYDGQRALANNAAAYADKPEIGAFMDEWKSIYDSKCGERGIFNRDSANRQARKTGRRKVDPEIRFGTNPCGEILLRSCQFCNLTEAVIRADDTLETLKEKVRIATILGTFQSMLTDFRYLRKVWKKNTEEERLLGVSLTGCMDHHVMAHVTAESKRWKEALKQVAIETNKEWSEILGISQSVSITCNKPSGCRPETALVTTDKGIYTLSELGMPEHPNEFKDVSESLDTFGAGKITKTYNNGVVPIYEINLNYGMVLRSTENHSWFTSLGQEIRTDELQKNDVLDINIGVYTSKHEATLDAVDLPYCNATAIKTPTVMSADLAWLLGYLWGDGSLSPAKHRIRFIDEHLTNLNKAKRILFEQFGISSTILKASENRNAYVLEKGSSHLWDWLLKNGLFKSVSSTGLNDIPKKIRESSQESIIAFLAGLFDADGWYKNGKGILSTSYDAFSEHIQHVGWTVGICFGRSLNTKGQNLQAVKHMWLMAISAHTTNDAWNMMSNHSNKIAGGVLNCSYKRTPGVVQSISISNSELATFDVETEAHWFYAGAVKSHNTVSQLMLCGSGIHGWYAPYYIRTVRADKKDPLAQLMMEAGVPHEDDVTKPDSTVIFSFPIAAPKGARLATDISALEQLEIWKTYHDDWCEHNPSVTIYVKEDEWLEVGAWVYKHFDDIGGLSFLPYSDHVYKQAPYQPCTKEVYEAAVKAMPKIPWDKLADYEQEDHTTGMQELACMGGACTI